MSFLNIPAYNWLSPVPTAADLPNYGNSNGDARVVLSNSNIFIWDGSAWNNSTGDIGSIGSSTDNAIVRWDGTGGSAVQDSSVLIDDSNNVSGVASLHVGSSGNSTTSAILELTSTSRAFLPPVMNTSQRDAISSPTDGLLIYNSQTNAFNGYISGAWGAIGGSSGISTLNTLTDTTQTFSVGTSGTDFAIVSATGNHAFNLPIASATNTGKLSNTDWSTFNSKQAAGNYITALTGEVSASGPGSASATVTNSAVIAKVLTGFSATTGSVSASDSILTAFNKIVGNSATYVVGPSSATDTAISVFDSTTGKLIKNTDLIYSSQTLKLVDDTSGGSGAANSLTIKPAAKTSGTGNGGNILIQGATSFGGANGKAELRHGFGSYGVETSYTVGGVIINGLIAFSSNNAHRITSDSNGPIIQANGFNQFYFQTISSQAAIQIGTTQGTIIPYSANSCGLGYYSTTVSPFKYGFFGDGGVVIGATSGTPSSIGNGYHLKLHQPTSSTAIYQQYCITTTTGTSSTDGTLTGLDSSGNFVIKQQENLPIRIYTNNTETFQFLASGGVFKNIAAGNEATGAGTALLGSNSPASTLTDPYTWLKIITSDGSTGYIPVWK